MTGIETRILLRLDAALTGTTGLLMAAGCWFLDDWLDLPFHLLLWPGLFLIAYVSWLLWLAWKPKVERQLVVFIACINVVWGIAIVILLTTGAIEPNALGWIFAIAQIVAVCGFATLLMRSRA